MSGIREPDLPVLGNYRLVKGPGLPWLPQNSICEPTSMTNAGGMQK